MDSHKRSIAKTLSWRFFATVITFSVTLVISYLYAKGDNIKFAAAVGVLDTSIKLGAYFAHERFWNRIDYGRVEQKGMEYEI